LMMLAADITKNRGNASEANVNAFFAAGYTKENLVDLILQISDKTAMNYLHNLTKVTVDFPLAPVI
jgi:alkylhydroperoxidase family enzyme